jgi:16S rRNA (guanine1207-N2)-methyltransferase
MPSHYFSSSPAGPDGLRPVRVRAAGQALTLLSGAGTFSRDGLDDGSKLLLETFLRENALREAAPEAQTWLDLGCGWGAVGCLLASVRPDCRILACDINRRAARLAARNAKDNALNINVWCGDGAAALRAEICDAVLCNPPVRAGNAVIAQLFEDSARVLKPGGTLGVVLRTAQGAKSWARRLEVQFGACRTVEQRDGFRILAATK